MWDPTFNASAVIGQYGYQGQYVQQRVGRYTCFSFVVNLTQICDPYTSYYLGGQCICYSTGQPCNRVRDLSQADYLYVGVTVSAAVAKGSQTDKGRHSGSGF